jgi:hypothetical protein
VSGDRSGSLAIWDINTGTPIFTSSCHNGPVAKIHLANGIIYSSGLKDGVLTAIDMRVCKPIVK